MTQAAPHDDAASPSYRSARSNHSVISLFADALLVVLFAVLGNIQHESGLAPADIWSTAWPFLLGLVLGWWLTFSWRYPHNVWPLGILLVAFTVTAGMLMRHFLTDGGVQLSFFIVACLSLAFFLLGRRLITRWLLPQRG